MHENTQYGPTAAQIDVSNHARLRAMQRLGVVDNVVERLRSLVDRAEEVETELVTNARALAAVDLILVTDHDGEVVQTVFERPPDLEEL